MIREQHSLFTGLANNISFFFCLHGKETNEKNEIKIFSHIVICQIQYLLKLVFGGSYHSIDYAKAFECVDHNTLWKILKEMEIPDH